MVPKHGDLQKIIRDGSKLQRFSRRAATGRSPAEIVGSNPTGGMDICLL